MHKHRRGQSFHFAAVYFDQCSFSVSCRCSISSDTSFRSSTSSNASLWFSNLNNAPTTAIDEYILMNPVAQLCLVTVSSLYLGGFLAHKGASYLEENEIFVPSDDDDDDWFQSMFTHVFACSFIVSLLNCIHAYQIWLSRVCEKRVEAFIQY